MKKNRSGKLKVKKLILFIFILVVSISLLVMGIGKSISFLLGKMNDNGQALSYYLLIGTDKNTGNEADAIVLTAWNSKDQSVTFISIPPNTRLARQEKKNQLIKTTFTEGGAEETRSAVENLLHLRIEKYAVFDFSNFTDYVNKIGGIDLYVEKSMEHENQNGEKDIELHQGYQKLDGERALGYTRYVEKKNGEISRIQRQERIMKTALLSMQDHFAFYNWMFARYVWKADETNMDSGEISSLAYNLTGYPKENLKFVILPGETQTIGKVETWVINPVEVQKAIALTISSDNG